MYIYAIFSKRFSRYYIGLTKNPASRLQMHNQGQVRSTRPYRPWQLAFAQEFDDENIREKEKYFKSGYGREIIKEIVANTGR